jgi:aspartate/methionine/tyrosine aminotransferase
VAAPIQFAAVEAYRPNPEISSYIEDCTAIHEIVTTCLHRKLRSADIRCPAPQGAFYLFPDWDRDRKNLVAKGIKTSMDISESLLRNWNVATLPGSDFGMPPDALCVRIATVDYDGGSALRQYRRGPEKARSSPDSFVNKVAPRLVAAMERLQEFTESFR